MSINSKISTRLEIGQNETIPALIVDQLHFHYPDGNKALDGISLRIDDGEKVALVGPNGAGKSTLMLHINGILTGDGEINVCGTPVQKNNLMFIRSRVGLVFQNPDDQLFSPTVFDDVAFGPLHMGYSPDVIQRQVSLALMQVGMDGYQKRLSHHLSMGEKKRIAIATVLSMSPSLLVLDEPSAGLDPRARRSLLKFLHDLPITMLVSTHDMLMVRDIFPRMIIMDHGQIVADGPTENLLKNQDLLEAHGLEMPI
jgi:cobalt/nickel transport system ATP-binding protein